MFQHNQLTCSAPSTSRRRRSARAGPRLTQFLTFNLEPSDPNLKSVWAMELWYGNFTNNLLIGYTKRREPRANQPVPVVVIGDGAGSAITSFDPEPFTPFNLLFYHT